MCSTGLPITLTLKSATGGDTLEIQVPESLHLSVLTAKFKSVLRKFGAPPFALKYLNVDIADADSAASRQMWDGDEIEVFCAQVTCMLHC